MKTLFKILAFILGIMALGAMSETYRIMTTNAPDIAPQRTYLSIMAFVFLIGLVWGTRYFWNKSKRE